MNIRLRAFLLFIPCIATAAWSQPPNVRHISGLGPIIGSSRELSAERPATAPAAPTPAVVSPAANPWQKVATIPGAVIHDISFPTSTVGYAAAELGQVWKTTDAGAHWSSVMDLGFPYYWYGVTTLSAKDVIITGFNDSNFEGIARWSHDGGKTWTDDIILTTRGWSFRVRFADDQNGLVVDGLNLDAPNAAHYTTDGGATAGDWTEVVPDPSPSAGWFGNQFSLLPDLHARVSGITYCSSKSGGAKWKCRPSIDSVFDGPVFFANNKAGWVGGGEISPSVEGWLHRTADGGKTWSGRTLDSPWPIREIRFLNANKGWAAGGNLYTNVGGIYFSKDGGQTWSLDVDTGAEMASCDLQLLAHKYQVWCAGYNGALNGVVYTLRRKR